jgi:F-type H+-transporting ATPase subunit b
MSDARFYVQVASWSQVAASILFIVVLVWLWVRFIQPAILAAQERANKQIAEAERHRDEANAMIDLLQSQVDGAVRDAEAIKERAKSQAEREYEAAIAEAKEAGERALASARGELPRALVAAREQLRVELLEKSLTRARSDAKRRVDAGTNARLVDQFLASLERR